MKRSPLSVARIQGSQSLADLEIAAPGRPCEVDSRSARLNPLRLPRAAQKRNRASSDWGSAPDPGIFRGMTPVSDGTAQTRRPRAIQLAQGPDAPSAHRRSGYPLSGCVPAEPDSVSPDRDTLHHGGTKRKTRTNQETQPMGKCNCRCWGKVVDAGEKAGIRFPVHPHILRHSTGFYLANKGMDTRAIQAYLGHRQIQHTVRYTELTADRFRDFWED